jgi:hypothetical protein
VGPGPSRYIHTKAPLSSIPPLLSGEEEIRDIQLGRNVLRFVFRIAPEPLMSTILGVLRGTCGSPTGTVLPGPGRNDRALPSLLSLAPHARRSSWLLRELET